MNSVERELLEEARSTILSLAEQQAMPDDSYLATTAKIDLALAGQAAPRDTVEEVERALATGETLPRCTFMALGSMRCTLPAEPAHSEHEVWLRKGETPELRHNPVTDEARDEVETPEVGREPGALRLYDRADGVRGRYCVGRWTGQYNEYWNEPAGRFAAFGTVYVGEDAARAKLEALASALSAPSTPVEPNAEPREKELRLTHNERELLERVALTFRPESQARAVLNKLLTLDSAPPVPGEGEPDA